jgi:hypothetical protein
MKVTAAAVGKILHDWQHAEFPVDRNPRLASEQIAVRVVVSARGHAKSAFELERRH